MGKGLMRTLKMMEIIKMRVPLVLILISAITEAARVKVRARV
jgi:hypothetical protein